MTRRSRILLALLIVLVAIGGGMALALRSPVVIGYWFERQARARFAEFTSRSDLGDDGLHVILCGTCVTAARRQSRQGLHHGRRRRPRLCRRHRAGIMEAAGVDAVSSRSHRRRVPDALPFRPHRRSRRVSSADLGWRTAAAAAGLWRARRRQGGRRFQPGLRARRPAIARPITAPRSRRSKQRRWSRSPLRSACPTAGTALRSSSTTTG